MTARWRGPSASRPITGVARAPVSRVMVRIHCPVLSDTPSARDKVGMRGAPRLDTTARQPLPTVNASVDRIISS